MHTNRIIQRRRLSADSFTYDLQGRLAATVIERYAADGFSVTERESTSLDRFKGRVGAEEFTTTAAELFARAN